MTEMVTSALLTAAIVYSLLGILMWGRATRGDVFRPLAWTMFAMAVWSAAYAGEIAAPTLSAKLLWIKLEYPAVVTVPVCWLFFVLEYTGNFAVLSRRHRMWAALIPVFIVAASWTNEYHRLVYAAFDIEPVGDLVLFVFDKGVLYWVNIIYSYLLLGIGSILLLLHTFQAASLYRTQAVLILVAVISPWIGSVSHIAGWFPIPWLDPTPFAFIPTGLIMLWAIARYRFLDLLPPAHNAVLQGLRDGVVLLNSHRQVVYLNHTAEEVFSITAGDALGRPAEEVFRVCAASILSRLGQEEQRVEITIDHLGHNRFLEVLILPGMDAPKRIQTLPSYTILFHDITHQKQAQAELKYHDAILRAVGLASELFLKSVSWETNIPQVLEHLGEAAEVSRVYIFDQVTAEDGISRVSQRYEWARPGVKPQINNPDLQNLEWLSAGYGRWEETLKKRKAISGPVCEFPESERTLLNEQGILSLVAMPVFVEGEFWGFMGFDDCEYERIWSEAELEALQAAADIFGAALSRRKIEKRLLDRQKSLNLLHEILRVALSMDKIAEMGSFLVNHLGSLIEADQCFLTLWDESRAQIIPTAAYGVNEESYRNMTVREGDATLTSSALHSGHTLIVEDAQDSPHVSPRIAALFDTRSVLVVPMISGEKKLGAVLLGFNGRHRFSTDEIMLSEQATNLVALALAKFQAVNEARRRADEVETLRRAGVAISETLNLQETTTRLLEQLAYVIPHDSASVQLLRDGELEIIGGEGWDTPSLIIGVRFPIPGDNPNSVVIQTRKPYLVNDTYETFPVFGATPHASHIRSWLGVPLIVHNEIIGLLAIDSREPNHFTTDNLDLASAFAGQVAVAIENARLFEEVNRLAVTDGLTGLYNRRHFLNLAEHEFERALRYKRDLSVMLFDIDHFKLVNDEYGHPVGDQVLQAISVLCQDKLREADPVGRYGGEEFIALLVESHPDLAWKAGERLRKEVETLIVPTEKGGIHVTISVGIAGVSDLTPNLDTLINRADQALYIAKHKGRNRVVVGR